jgi:hypothetical protein
MILNLRGQFSRFFKLDNTIIQKSDKLSIYFIWIY